MAESADATPKSERHVRFANTDGIGEHGTADGVKPIQNGKGDSAAAAAEGKVMTPPLAKPKEAEPLIPRRVVIKDANAHLATATVLLIFLFLIAFQMDDFSDDMKQQAEKDADQIRTRPHRGRFVNEHKSESSVTSAPRREAPCSFFLATSSLPGSQTFGIYAGTNFIEGTSMFNYSQVSYSVNGDNGEPLLVPYFGFLLGHHHILHNLRGGPFWTSSPELSTGSEVKASRFIKEGEELFLNYEMHPASVVGGKFSYPVKGDYDLAQDIIRDELDYLRPFRGRGKSAKPDEGAFRLIRKTIDKLNTQVAKMLPITTKELTELDFKGTPLALGVMRNKTMDWLRRYGQCLDDAALFESNDGVAFVAKRSFKFGDVVLPVPLYTTTLDARCSSNENEECSVWQYSVYKHCYGHNETSLLLCPLSPVVLASRSDDANVVFRWSSWNPLNQMSHKHNPDHVTGAFARSLTWDLVAIKEIEAGEEIKLRLDKGSNFGGLIAKELLPAAWRDINDPVES